MTIREYVWSIVERDAPLELDAALLENPGTRVDLDEVVKRVKRRHAQYYCRMAEALMDAYLRRTIKRRLREYMMGARP